MGGLVGGLVEMLFFGLSMYIIGFWFIKLRIWGVGLIRRLGFFYRLIYEYLSVVFFVDYFDSIYFNRFL